MPPAIPPELAERPAVRKVQSFAPDALLAAADFRGQLALTIAPARLRDICELLRRDPEFEFDQLVDVTAVDHYPVEPRFEVVYHLRSLRLSTASASRRLRRRRPRIQSLIGLCPVPTCWSAKCSTCLGFTSTAIPICAPADARRLGRPSAPQRSIGGGYR
jgi:NADH-quinone oxidoreductase subunit C